MMVQMIKDEIDLCFCQLSHKTTWGCSAIAGFNCDISEL